MCLDENEPDRIIDSERLNPMLMAIACAARQMPVLQWLSFDLSTVFLPIANVSFFASAKMGNEWRVRLGNGLKYNVPEDLREAWKVTASKIEVNDFTVPLGTVETVHLYRTLKF